MRAVAVVDERLFVSEIEKPMPGAHEVLIRVLTAGVNRADILQRKGRYPAPPGASEILGLEVSGVVDAVGTGVVSWKPGDQVCALLPGGGYAEYCIAHQGSCLPVPASVTPNDAGALPEAVFTVWANLFHQSMLSAGETLLVQGGSSGIGSMAIQMARAFGLRVLATAGTDEKCEFCRSLGAEEAFNYREDWAQGVRTLRPEGVDVVLDMVGGDYFPLHLSLLGTGGRLIHIAASKGREVTADLGAIMSKRLVVTGSTLRGRSVEEKAALGRRILEKVWPKIDSGEIRPIVDAVFPLEQANEAHALMESSRHKGKILISM